MITLFYSQSEILKLARQASEVRYKLAITKTTILYALTIAYVVETMT